MSQEIEIEYKTLLTKQEYDNLLFGLDFPPSGEIQINYYFETDTNALKRHQSALRIREKAGNYTLTLKEPHEKGILETHDKLTEDECKQWINDQPVAKQHVEKQLKNLHISISALRFIGSLKTERRSFTQNDLIYVLDKSYYNGLVDYELEIEALSATAGQQALDDVMEQFPIAAPQSITKIERFFNSLRAR